MSKIVLVARLLLGLIFFVFGLNGFLNFLPAPPDPPPGLASFAGGLMESGFMNLVKVVEVLAGAMLLAGVFVPLALTLLAPIVITILFVHTVLDPSGLPIAAVVTVLNLFLAWAYRSSFAGVLNRSAKPG